jgi:N-acetylglucosaminyldiphosphoundecaprenol N-acetyl-beta-D-mannosaminyltransferase
VRHKVLGLGIDKMGMLDTLEKALEMAKNKSQGFLCFANVHMASEAQSSEKIAESIHEAAYIVADGVPLVWALQQVHKVDSQRVAGMDFLPLMLEKAQKNNLSVFFYGDSTETLDAISHKLACEFPQLRLAGMYAPPRLPIEELDHCEYINRCKPDLVFVALGCPKQELWMAKYYCRIHAPLFGLGAAFKVFAGKSKRAPVWMQKSGLEWAYRLSQEPGRLFVRYLSTNTHFVWWFIINIIKRKPEKVISHRF